MNELTFDPDTHTYRLDGELLPSVSEIIAPLGNSAEEIGDLVEFRWEQAAERGVLLHALLADLLLGNEPEIPTDYEEYADSVRLFLDEHRLEPYAVEEPTYSERLGVAGTPDFVGLFDGTLAILDYKFVSQVAKTKVKAQLNLYADMVEEHGLFPEELLCVQFLPDGKYRLYPTARDTTEEDCCLQLYRLKQKRHPKGVIA